MPPAHPDAGSATTAHPRFGTEAEALASRQPDPPVSGALRELGSARPPHALPQSEVLARARRVLSPRFPQFERLAPAFQNAGVEMRRSVVPFARFEETRGWKARDDLYVEGATRLYVEAATTALDQAGWEPEEVDIAVTVSSLASPCPRWRRARRPRWGSGPVSSACRSSGSAARAA